MKNLYAFAWLWLAICTLASTSIFAQTPAVGACGITVNAGNDATVCDSGAVVNLQGTVNGTALTTRWSPALGVADSSRLGTVARLDTTTTYRLTVRSINAQNLIVNGNFNADSAGITSDYQYTNTDLRPDGRYAVVRRANDVRNSFDNCSDHTGGGEMMVVNASGNPNKVWCQRVTIQPNTEYLFSAWAASMESENPAQLQFSINNNLIGNVFTAPSQTCTWREFTTNWRSNTATTAEICVSNVNRTAAGNDFAIDDLSFRQICETTDSVTVTVANLNADWNSPGDLCQSNSVIELDTLLTPNATPGGTWTIDSVAATTLNPATLSVGAHNIRYTVTLGTCIKQITQRIDIRKPVSAGTALAAAQLCTGLDSLIRLANLLQNEDSLGIWTFTANSSGFNAANGTFNTANAAPGTYNFTYTVSGQGACQDAVSNVQVVVAPPPVANAGADVALNCTVDMVTLGNRTTSTGNNFTYQWTATNGSAITNPNLALTEIDEADTYTLLVTNTTSGCTASDSVTVTSNITNPSATLDIQALTCNQTRNGAIRVNATGEGPFTYALNAGNFNAKNEFPSLMPGTYTLTVRDKNGCDTTLQAELFQPEGLDVEIQTNILDNTSSIIQGDSLELKLQSSKPDAQLTSIVWSPDSVKCTTCNTISVRPQFSTVYTVRVTDANGCVATDELEIFVQQVQRVYIPTAFSPDGDGTNDQFYISAGQEVSRVKTFRIFNRWGTLVYSRDGFAPNDPTTGWDGTFNGQRPQIGVYVYVANLEMITGEVVVVKGDVTVVK